MFYLIGAALVFVGNVTFLWKSILNADELRFKKEKILQSFKMNISVQRLAVQVGLATLKFVQILDLVI